MNNEKGFSLIGTLIAIGIMAVLSLGLTSIMTNMVRANTTANANSDVLEYVNTLRSSIQSSADSTAVLIGNQTTGSLILNDPITNKVIAAAGYKQNPVYAWQVKNVRFDNLVAVPSQAGLYRGTLTVVFQFDNKRIVGASIKTRVIGDVYCLAPSGLITSCYGTTDLVTLAQDNCKAIQGTWDSSKAFGSQCSPPAIVASIPISVPITTAAPIQPNVQPVVPATVIAVAPVAVPVAVKTPVVPVISTKDNDDKDDGDCDKDHSDNGNHYGQLKN